MPNPVRSDLASQILITVFTIVLCGVIPLAVFGMESTVGRVTAMISVGALVFLVGFRIWARARGDRRDQEDVAGN